MEHRKVKLKPYGIVLHRSSEFHRKKLLCVCSCMGTGAHNFKATSNAYVIRLIRRIDWCILIFWLMSSLKITFVFNFSSSLCKLDVSKTFVIIILSLRDHDTQTKTRFLFSFFRIRSSKLNFCRILFLQIEKTQNS